MLSKKPLETNPVPDRSSPSEAQRFLSYNREVYEKLIVFLDFAEQLTIGLIEINFSQETDMLIQALREDLRCQEFQIEELNYPDKNLRFLKDEIVNDLGRITLKPGKKLVLMIRGLENSIGSYGDYPPMLQDLNFVRDAYQEGVPYPILIILPDYALTRLAKFAPDFWDWRSGIFLFKTAQETRQAAWDQAMSRDQTLRRIMPEFNQDRVDLLHRLLMECRPSGQPSQAYDLLTCSQILLELGSIYIQQGQSAKAREYLEEALAMTPAAQDSSVRMDLYFELIESYILDRQLEIAIVWAKRLLDLSQEVQDRKRESEALHWLGNCWFDQRDFDRAHQAYQDSLTILEDLGDQRSQASTYHNLGYVAQEQREYEEARRCYLQALEIFVAFNDRYEQASTYHQLGYVAQEQREYEEARRCYLQALEIYVAFNDRYSQAVTYHNLGIVAQEQREYEEARRCYLQALEIKVAFNDRYSQASTYGQLGLLAQAMEDLAEAQTQLIQALEIFVEFGDQHNAGQVMSILGDLYRSTQDQALVAAVAPIVGLSEAEVRSVFEADLEGSADPGGSVGD